MWDVKIYIIIILPFPCYSFTLTMWDVKDERIFIIFSGFKFYLNYVGCKDKSLIVFNKSFSCFTLTMWDVKFELLITYIYLHYRFTLTMWDVKLFFSRIRGSIASSFYLNYVGCKVSSHNYIIFLFERFTLTMWDVKIEVGSLCLKT